MCFLSIVLCGTRILGHHVLGSCHPFPGRPTRFRVFQDSTELGRTGAHFYLTIGTIETFEEQLKPTASDAEILHTLCCASEFSNIKVTVVTVTVGV